MASTQTAADEPSSPTERRVLWVLFFILALDLMAFACILPLFPAIMDYYSAHSLEDDAYARFEAWLKAARAWLGAPDVARFDSVFFAGALGSLFCLLQFVSSAVLGALSDALGRRPVLLLAVTGSLCAYGLWAAAAESFGVFVGSRVVGGLSKASVSVAIALVADVCPAQRRGSGMAVVGVSFSAAFLLGPMLGAWFARRARSAAIDAYPFGAPAIFAVSVTVAELLVVYFFLPETLSKQRRKTRIPDVFRHSWKYINPLSLFRFDAVEHGLSTKDRHTVRNIGWIYFVYLFLYSGLEFTLTFFTHLRFQFSSTDQGKMYFFTGLLMVVLQGGYVRRIPVANLQRTAQLGLGVIIPAYVLVGLANSTLMLYMGLALYGFASALVVPCLTTLVANCGSAAQKGAVLGVLRSIGALARAVGPLAASALFWWFGPTACYITGGLLLSLPWLLMKRFRLPLAD